MGSVQPAIGRLVMSKRCRQRSSEFAGQVVIREKAFGINHAEMHMRRGEWAEAAEVSGIECVGLVKACHSKELENE